MPIIYEVIEYDCTKAVLVPVCVWTAGDWDLDKHFLTSAIRPAAANVTLRASFKTASTSGWASLAAHLNVSFSAIKSSFSSLTSGSAMVTYRESFLCAHLIGASNDVDAMMIER